MFYGDVLIDILNSRILKTNWPGVRWAPSLLGVWQGCSNLWLAVKCEGTEQAVEHPRTEGALLEEPAGVQHVLTSPAAHPTNMCRWRARLLIVPPGTVGMAGCGRSVKENDP